MNLEGKWMERSHHISYFLLFETSKSKSSHVSTYSENQNGTSAGIGVVVNFFIIFYFNRK